MPKPIAHFKKQIQAIMDGDETIDFVQIGKYKFVTDWIDFQDGKFKSIVLALYPKEVNKTFSSISSYESFVWDQLDDCLDSQTDEENPYYITFNQILDIQENLAIVDENSFRAKLAKFEILLRRWADEAWDDMEDDEKRSYQREQEREWEEQGLVTSYELKGY